MKYLLFAVVLLTGCATTKPTENGDLQITVKADLVAQCNEQGGCALFTQAEVLGMLNEAVQAGATAAQGELDSHGCKRGSM